MEQILTKIEKRYDMGFVLTDTELKKVVLLLVESLQKQGIESIKGSIIVRLKNGALLSLTSVDEVLSLENEDDQEITELNIFVGDEEGNYVIEINLDALPIKDSGQLLTTYPVTVLVVGKSKDWARITWLEIEGRLKKIERTSVSLSSIIKNAPLLIFWTGIIAFFIWMLVDLSAQDKNNYHKASEVIRRLDELAKSQSVNSIQDLKDLYISVEKEKQQINIKNNPYAPKQIDEIAEFKSTFRISSIAILVVLLVIYLCYYLLHRPNYNFVWGEYKHTFEKIERRRHASLNIVVVVVILGVVVNVSSSFIIEYWLK